MSNFLSYRRWNSTRFFMFILVLMSALMLAMSPNVMAHKSEPSTESAPKAKAVEVVKDPIVVRVTGYAAYTKKKGENNEAKRLKAIRASKLDAYRAMAERVYGISISGHSSVKDFALQSDSFGAVVDSYVRGARVVSIMENKQTGIETVLEVLLPGNFHDCLNGVNNFKYGVECLRPFGQRLTEVSEAAASKKTGSRTMQSVYFLK